MNKYYFADIILPLAVKGNFTYKIPDTLLGKIKPGCRAIVQFGNKKLYSGLVYKIHSESSDYENIKEIVDVIDEKPLINEKQLNLWDWISVYYMCTRGEVMKAALPSALSLESTTQIAINPDFASYTPFDEPVSLLIKLIENRETIALEGLPHYIGKKNTLVIVNDLINRNILQAGESISDPYKSREETFIVLAEKFSDAELNGLLDSLKNAPRQFDVLSTYIRITGCSSNSGIVPVRKSILMKESGVSANPVNSLIEKGVLSGTRMEVGRLQTYEKSIEPINVLSAAQYEALDSVKKQFKSKDVVLLHGVTSSGKTEIYIHLIEEQMKKGKQVLYMLPEIALTTQIIERLKRHFGSVTGVYHSRFNDAEKVEIWKKVKEDDTIKGYRLILGVRSSVFLPFNNLGLVIVDEEHDGSYKQQDPAPRYNARDTAIVLAGLHGAKTIIGSATPSVESYYNTETTKYGLTNLKERFGKINLPDIVLADTRESYRKKLMVSHFTPELLNIMDAALEKGEQVALFQNRRGFAPFIECAGCGWVPGCNQCAVKLTYHKGIKKLVCHYCGHSVHLPASCGNCGSTDIVTRGFGTEKIEDEIKIVFPKARVARMDQDTTRNKNSFNKIIDDFENRRIDILIGTQMISKGLDFENLTVVGVLNADSMLNYPDFRAHERSYQLIEQVSGRAGRRNKQGKVVIQTSDPAHNVIRFVLSHNYSGMYKMQIEERKIFKYPPFIRLIRLNIKHKEMDKLNFATEFLANDLKKLFGNRVLGPEAPLIGKVQLWYIKTILLKIEKDKPVAKAKSLVYEAIERTHCLKGFSNVRISIDVDPL
jgi:primosomal protein N' (replication factor Y)